MENTKELALVKSEKFGTVRCDFWQNKNKECNILRS